MFLRKLFKVGDKARWLALELLVVFIGVYLAFLFQSYNERIKESKEKEKVFSSLKYELEIFRVLLPGQAAYAKGLGESFLPKLRNGQYVDFSDWRFIEPQYTYQIIEYAIGLENTNIVDFQLYDRLQSLYTVIKKLEHAERLVMAMGHQYRAIPADLPKTSNEYKLRKADNLLNFQRFIVFMRDRANNLQAVAEESAACLEIINALMDPTNRRAIESDLIINNAHKFGSLEKVLPQLKELFPDFSVDEIKELYNKPESD